ncbi:type VI secretion system baseplate subunit TssG [Variovorax paradoxus]|uniref:Type VI secretion system baseplate subunit TssG n=1 Tax=Variovorax paradoxus TaxID=34073 RepID=A0A5Q0M8M3_VARPD|nr:type VI secretion system baseplate subunit TssG [Variovorax paradoxus]QFZ85856.1 type VI secretion system baseplate subunit TssG [Variovorax paradoxus]
MTKAREADPGGPLHEMLGRLRRTPWKFGFLSLLRRLGASHLQHPSVGLARRPQQESFRLGQAAALTFAPREIASVVLPGESERRMLGASPTRSGNNPALPVVRLYSLGLLGPNGPLPLHFTELVRDRTENHNDSTLADFLDLFHHRYLTHMYRAWAQGQAAAGLDRPEDEAFSRYIARLTGHDPLEIRDSVLPSHARLAASTHLAREARNPDGLAATLAQFFAVPVQLDEFVRHWIRIDPEDQSHLGLARSSSIMGLGAIAGEVVADRQNKFRLVLGPLSLAQYLRFTPQGQDLALLVEWVRGFVGYEFVWEVELRVRNDSTPPARLEDTEKLGWSTWLGGSGGAEEGRRAVDAARSSPGYTVGMVFEPEAYIGSCHHGNATVAR